MVSWAHLSQLPNSISVGSAVFAYPVRGVSVLQVSIDLLSWDFSVMTIDDSNISGSPKVRVITVTHANIQTERGRQTYRRTQTDILTVDYLLPQHFLILVSTRLTDVRVEYECVPLLPFRVNFRRSVMPSYGCPAKYCGNVGRLNLWGPVWPTSLNSEHS